MPVEVEKSVIDLPWDSHVIKDTPEEMIIAGYAYTPDFIDHHGEFMRKEVLAKSATTFLNRPHRRNIMLFHLSTQIGEVIDTYEHEGKKLMTGMDEKGFFVIARVFGDLSISPHVFQAIREKRIDSFSIGGFKRTIPSSLNGQPAKEIISYDLHEVTIVPAGAHPLAKFVALKSLCECGEACLLELSKKSIKDAEITYFPNYLQVFSPSEQKYYIRQLPDRKIDAESGDNSTNVVNISTSTDDTYKSSQTINTNREDMTETIKIQETQTNANTTSQTAPAPVAPATSATVAQTPAPTATATAESVVTAPAAPVPAPKPADPAPVAAPAPQVSVPVAPDMSVDIKALTESVKTLAGKIDTMSASYETSQKSFGDNVKKVIEEYVAKDKGASTGPKVTVADPASPKPDDVPLIASLKSYQDAQKLLDKAGVRAFIR